MVTSLSPCMGAPILRGAGKRGDRQIATRGNVADRKLFDQEVTAPIGKRAEWNQIQHPIGSDAHTVHIFDLC